MYASQFHLPFSGRFLKVTSRGTKQKSDLLHLHLMYSDILKLWFFEMFLSAKFQKPSLIYHYSN